MAGARPWPFVEAAKIVDGLLRSDDPPEEIVFETGFGPSGLPHVGTFGEVARTTFVRRALAELSDVPTRLITFSDDMDGLRKVPLNVPQREMLATHLGRPLSSIPDPFGEADSYSGFMNRKLQRFLDAFGFEYEFRSSSDAYRSGRFDEGLLRVLHHADDIARILVPTLGAERRQGWTPFFPVCSACGRVYTTEVTAMHPDRGTLEYTCGGAFEGVPGCGHAEETPVTGGRVKVGWKIDWALRWYALGVHYEMYGKDLIESANLSKRIVKVLGGRPPVGLFYEMFLDENGQKISKKIGKGVTVDTWIRYAPVESLLLFMYGNPRKAKRLHYEVIPQFADDMLGQMRRYPGLDAEERAWSPLWFFRHAGDEVPEYHSGLDYSLIRNLVACLGTTDPAMVKETLRRYDPDVDRDGEMMDRLIAGAIAFDQDLVAPQRSHRIPDGDEALLLRELARRVDAAADDDPEALQSLVFDLARERDLKPRDVFKLVYETLLGQPRGPRFGSFALAMGRPAMAEALRAAASRTV
jgi:lysyl-tRNA synthetase, class I